MNRYDAKTDWRRVLLFILIIAIAIAAVGFIAHVVNDDREKISSLTSFARGGLDSNGKFIDTKKSIYTKEAFGCQGLRVEPNFEFIGTYDVYYYDYDGKFIEAKKGIQGVYDEDYPLAKLARIVINPELEKGEDKIAWYGVSSLAKKFEITVDKDQAWRYESENLYTADNVTLNSGFVFDNSADPKVVNIIDSTVHKLTEHIAVAYKHYDVFVRVNTADVNWTGAVVVTNENDMQVVAFDQVNMSGVEPGEWTKLTVSIEGEINEDYKLLVKMPLTADCYIFGYN